MALRRGFMSEANAIAREVRSELGLGALDPLDPMRLAEHLAIPVIPLSAMASTAAMAVDHLLRVEPNVFSAVTVFAGTKRTIVHNDGHVAGRIVSNLAHELAHGLLLHPATPALDDHGCREWNQDIEDEASYLGGALLITEDAALAIARAGTSEAAAATDYGVSKDMIRYRLNVTGARKRVARSRGLRVV
jgi:Zn-dependent peptidase ImmA (M78 family)